jgi:hypothetical protein
MAARPSSALAGARARGALEGVARPLHQRVAADRPRLGVRGAATGAEVIPPAPLFARCRESRME